MNIKILGFGLVSLGAALFASTTVAHDINFKTVAAANGAGATDVWAVECFNSAAVGNTYKLEAKLRELTPNSFSKLTLVIYKDGKAQTTTDLSGADAVYSPFVSVAAGNGVYSLMVAHTDTANKAYNIEYHCLSANNDHTPTTVPTTPVQDQ